jgi:Sec-independent protein secretion pathway component TatC
MRTGDQRELRRLTAFTEARRLIMLRSGMSQIAVLAVGVTLIGLTLVIVSGWLAGRLTPAQRLMLSVTCLVLYGIGLLFARTHRPSGKSVQAG